MLPFNVIVYSSENIIFFNNESYNERRSQFNASLLLNRLNNHFLKNNIKIFRTLGILDKDIYMKGKNFIYGISQEPINHYFYNEPKFALISIFRLRNHSKDNTSNNILFHSRILKQVMHELGHTLGLEHCQKFCVMRFSISLLEIDNKPAKFCDKCSNVLKML